jgi:hypothetical protein
MLRSNPLERSMEECSAAFGSDPAGKPGSELNEHAVRGRNGFFGRADIDGIAHPDGPRHFRGSWGHARAPSGAVIRGAGEALSSKSTPVQRGSATPPADDG